MTAPNEAYWDCAQAGVNPIAYGKPGIGKSATAHALANDLGAWKDPMLGVYGPTVLTGPEFNMEALKDLFGKASPFRYHRDGWHVLIIEELENVHSNTSNQAKENLDARRVAEYKLVVIATSNDTSKLTRAMRGRFDKYECRADQGFADACYDRLAWIWGEETDRPIPRAYRTWGWDVTGTTPEFSMREALTMMQRYLRV